jgi:LysM repeat protein
MKRSLIIIQTSIAIVTIVLTASCGKKEKEILSPQMQALQHTISSSDPISRTKAILELRDIDDTKQLWQLVPALITTLNDNTELQIPENIHNAEITLSRFSRGSELRFREGDLFLGDGGQVVIPGKSAKLRVSTPSDEAYEVLKGITDKDFGKNAKQWQEWWQNNNYKAISRFQERTTKQDQEQSLESGGGSSSDHISKRTPNESDVVHRTYIVQPGDTLYFIAKKMYGEGAAWRKILSANEDILRGDPSRIKVGMQLKLPDLEPNNGNESKLTEAETIE